MIQGISCALCSLRGIRLNQVKQEVKALSRGSDGQVHLIKVHFPHAQIALHVFLQHPLARVRLEQVVACQQIEKDRTYAKQVAPGVIAMPTQNLWSNVSQGPAFLCQ